MSTDIQKETKDPYNLQRFIDAQDYAGTYETAKQEIEAGSKETHWIWFIFPQLAGMGHSHYSVLYGITGRAEARAYIENDILRERLLAITEALYRLKTDDIMSVMWEIDCYKVRSCMTLFQLVAPEYDIFQKVLDKYFMSTQCRFTADHLL